MGSVKWALAVDSQDLWAADDAGVDICGCPSAIDDDGGADWSRGARSPWTTTSPRAQGSISVRL
jgi:hypothetical protein